METLPFNNQENNLFLRIAEKFSRTLEAEKFFADEEIIMTNGDGNAFVEEDNDVGFCMNGLKMVQRFYCTFKM